RKAECSMQSNSSTAVSGSLFLLLKLELKIQGDLQTSRRTSPHKTSEEGRTQVAYRRTMVHSIQHIKGVQGDRCTRSWLLLLLRAPEEVPRPSQVERRPTRPVHAVSPHSWRAIIRDTIVVVVAAGCNAVRLSRGG